jgi:DNA-directed RNA polymerase III subunit RPC6
MGVKGLFKAMQGADKKVMFKAVQKEEMKLCVPLFLASIIISEASTSKKEMGGEENMVLSQIQAAGNEGDRTRYLCPSSTNTHFGIGIWTKHLKAKTKLHQTVITRCLKSLESKQLIKAIKSVKVR